MAPDLRCNQHNRDQIPVMTTVHGAGPVHTSGGIQQTDRPQRSDSVDSNSGFNSLIIAARLPQGTLQTRISQKCQHGKPAA